MMTLCVKTQNITAQRITILGIVALRKLTLSIKMSVWILTLRNIVYIDYSAEHYIIIMLLCSGIMLGGNMLGGIMPSGIMQSVTICAKLSIAMLSIAMLSVFYNKRLTDTTRSGS
jgi:hypothetical protein